MIDKIEKIITLFGLLTAVFFIALLIFYVGVAIWTLISLM